MIRTVDHSKLFITMMNDHSFFLVHDLVGGVDHLTSASIPFQVLDEDDEDER